MTSKSTIHDTGIYLATLDLAMLEVSDMGESGETNIRPWLEDLRVPCGCAGIPEETEAAEMLGPDFIASAKELVHNVSGDCLGKQWHPAPPSTAIALIIQQMTMEGWCITFDGMMAEIRIEHGIEDEDGDLALEGLTIPCHEEEHGWLPFFMAVHSLLVPDDDDEIEADVDC